MVLRDWTRSLDRTSDWTRAETNDLVQILMEAGFSTVQSLAASTWPACRSSIRDNSSMATDNNLLAVLWLWLEASTNPPGL